MWVAGIDPGGRDMREKEIIILIKRAKAILSDEGLPEKTRIKHAYCALYHATKDKDDG